jgi:hypothetical protein
MLAGLCASEPTTAEIAKAIRQIETGAVYRGEIGKAGEIGMYQITPALLKQIGGTSRGTYADFCCVWHHFRTRTATWQEAAAAYHRGLGGINKIAARDYAQRVSNLIGR